LQVGLPGCASYPFRGDRNCKIDTRGQAGRVGGVLDRPVRTRKYRVMTTLERLNNRGTRWSLRKGWGLPAFALLETTGRRSGLPRQTPVGNGLTPEGDTFWLVAAHGRQADYVRNLLAQPRVRVKVKGIWRTGTAVVLPDDDTAARWRALPYKWDSLIGRLMESTPLTIRIDLDPLR
jgi:deazaflavin-dependent oxidoreductase (nitroreductase family)